MTTDTVKVEIVRDEKGVKIAQYSRTMAALAELEKKHKGMVFDVTTTAGMKEAKAARKELRELRVDLENKRKELKAPLLDYTRALDGQAKDITARIVALEAPIDEQVKAEEQRKAREKAEAEAAERARIDAHRRVIEAMRNKPLELIGAKPTDLERAFLEIQRTDLSGLEEFAGEAALVKDEAAGKLHELWTQAMEREEAAAKEAYAQRQRDAKAAEERAAREAELAELEELRRFKAEQEAEKIKSQAARESPEKAGGNPLKTTKGAVTIERAEESPEAIDWKTISDRPNSAAFLLEVFEWAQRHEHRDNLAETYLCICHALGVIEPEIIDGVDFEIADSWADRILDLRSEVADAILYHRDLAGEKEASQGGGV